MGFYVVFCTNSVIMNTVLCLFRGGYYDTCMSQSGKNRLGPGHCKTWLFSYRGSRESGSDRF